MNDGAEEWNAFNILFFGGGNSNSSIGLSDFINPQLERMTILLKMRFKLKWSLLHNILDSVFHILLPLDCHHPLHVHLFRNIKLKSV